MNNLHDSIPMDGSVLSADGSREQSIFIVDGEEHPLNIFLNQDIFAMGDFRGHGEGADSMCGIMPYDRGYEAGYEDGYAAGREDSSDSDDGYGDNYGLNSRAAESLDVAMSYEAGFSDGWSQGYDDAGGGYLEGG